VRGWTGRGGDAARLARVDEYVFPGPVIERFGHEHPDVHPEDSALVEDAARQWFRLLARRPQRPLAMPSRAVADFWLAFLHAESAYRQFCEDALGGFVPHRPPPSAPGEDVADGPGLLRTLEAAQRDEPDAPHGLPWLFRVDARVKILNGRRYLATCGGGRECYSVAGTVCLHHVPGAGKTGQSRLTIRRPKLDDLPSRNDFRGIGG
jgi:hypothetical protein